METQKIKSEGALRINKYLATAGLCSRREADKLIEKGKVFINGRRARLGDTVNPEDTVEVDHKPVKADLKKIYIAFHKPYGVITTTNRESENNIMEYIDLPQRVFPVGRLDVHSSGLILLTNDGDIVNQVLKAEHKQEKEYMVNVDKSLTPEMILQLERGVIVEGRKTLPAKVKKISDRQFTIVIVQGLNRQVRQMCEKMGYNVTILKRIRIAGIELGDLPRGKWRVLTAKEIASLKGNKA
ncbi:MAG TPA: pseudouridine synthase [Candidatus Gracilibacteria bacterium]|nr:pseudouridine synthase [Candidatus Gracilibacteria bacterium]